MWRAVSIVFVLLVGLWERGSLRFADVGAVLGSAKEANGLGQGRIEARRVTGVSRLFASAPGDRRPFCRLSVVLLVYAWPQRRRANWGCLRCESGAVVSPPCWLPAGEDRVPVRRVALAGLTAFYLRSAPNWCLEDWLRCTQSATRIRWHHSHRFCPTLACSQRPLQLSVLSAVDCPF
ncbi:unnamed protein product [Ostreobium quekettii]|uniref:Secreted protein n=1 Tax=Ostreobium quekettii TaxID=121088 RepID=A0A8S1IQM2_9CHLO|nr:unnamed protein product [Ostreobium quekettii]